jgi:hypothetical protein
MPLTTAKDEGGLEPDVEVVMPGLDVIVVIPPPGLLRVLVAGLDVERVVRRTFLKWFSIAAYHLRLFDII